ncbi:MAG: hypothetical protein ACOCWG_05560 [bacterium]
MNFSQLKNSPNLLNAEHISRLSVLSSEEMLSIVGGITYCGYIAVMQYLWQNGHHDQAVSIQQMFNSGNLEFSDWNYIGAPPSC